MIFFHLFFSFLKFTFAVHNPSFYSSNFIHNIHHPNVTLSNLQQLNYYVINRPTKVDLSSK